MNQIFCNAIYGTRINCKRSLGLKLKSEAAKFILKAKDGCETRLGKLNLLSLENRRVLTDVTFFFLGTERTY